MRYLACFVCVVAMVAPPVTANAQADEEGEEPTLEEPSPSAEPASEEPVPSAEPTPEEPALQLKLDSAGIEVVPSPPRTADGYTLEELELRKRRAALGLIAPAAVTVAGVVPLVLGTSGDCLFDGFVDNDSCRRRRAAGMVLTIAGGVGMIVGSILVGVRKHELNLAVHDYTPEEVELRVKRAKIGVYASGGALVVGLAMTAAGFASYEAVSFGFEEEGSGASLAVGWTGVALMTGGFFGLIIAGSMLRVRNQKLRELQEAHYGRPRKVQWDPAQWRFLF